MRRMMNAKVVGALLFAVFVTSCAPALEPLPTPEATAVGEPLSGMSTASATIGAAGGSLVSTDNRLTVRIPAGALAADATISIAPISNKAHGGIGAAYRLSGAETFAQPVSLTFAFNDADLEGSAPGLLDVAFQTDDGFWALADSVTVDAAAKTITASTTHFSDWSIFSRLRLSPNSARLKVNQARVFELTLCAAWAKGARPEDRTDRSFSCRPIGTWYGAKVASNWSVDGVAGGNSTIGTIFPDIEKGGYAAPAKKPSPDTVTVSVDVTNPGDPSDVVKLQSQVTITEEDEPQVIDVSATYSQPGQRLIEFVRGDVTDEGFTFRMRFPLDVDETLVPMNRGGGGVSRLVDDRQGCVGPTALTTWDELSVGSIFLAGADLYIQGTKTTSSIKLGVGEGDCAVDTRTVDAKTESVAMQVLLPQVFFTSTTFPDVPVVETKNGWTFTYTLVR
jgi:hypothetical protein